MNRSLICILGIVLPALTVGGSVVSTRADELDPAERQKLRREWQQHADKVAALMKQDKLDEAIDEMEKVYELQKRLSSENDKSLDGALDVLIKMYERKKDFVGLRSVHRRRVALRTKLYGADHWRTAEARWEDEFAGRRAKFNAEQFRRLGEAKDRVLRGIELFQRGESGRAAKLLREAAEMTAALLGDDNPYYAFTRGLLAGTLRDQGDLAAAEEAYAQALAIQQKWLSEDHPETVLNLYNLAGVYQFRGDDDRAAPRFTRALKAARRLVGEGALSQEMLHKMVCTIGIFYLDGDDLNAAKPLLEEAERMSRKLGEDHPDHGRDLANLSYLYCSRYDFPRAEKSAAQAVEIVRKARGEKHVDFARAVFALAQVYRAMGLYAKAAPLLEQALALFRQTVGDKDSAYLRCLTDVGLLALDRGDVVAAEPPLTKLAEVWRDRPGGGIRYAHALHNLGLLRIRQGDFKRAEQAYRQALQLKEKLRGPDHLDCAITLENLGGLYQETAEFTQAEKELLRAEKIRLRAGGRDSPQMIAALHELGTLYHRMGQYDRAEPLLRKVVELRERYQGSEHPDYAKSLDNLGKLRNSLGDYKEAIRLLAQALQIRKKVLPAHHPDYAVGLNNLASLFLKAAMYPEARKSFQEALDITRKVKGETHQDYLLTLNNLALTYRGEGQAEEAEKLLSAARAGWERLRKADPTGRTFPGHATCLGNLAALSADRKDYRGAEALFRAALDIDRCLLGEQHPDCAYVLTGLARVLFADGRKAEALAMMQRALDVEQQSLDRVFAFTSEEAMRLYLDTVAGSLELLVSMAADYPESVPAALTWTLRRKAMILDSICRFRASIRLLSEDDELAGAVREVQGLQRRLAESTAHPPLGVALEAMQRRKDEWQKRKERLEADIHRRLSEKRVALVADTGVIDLDHVRGRLPSDGVLIEFLRVAPHDFQIPYGPAAWGEPRYFAFVLSADAKAAPRLIDLGNAEEMDAVIDRVGKAIEGFPDARGKGRSEASLERAFRTASADLSRRLLEPLRLARGKAATLVLAPDGDLNRVPFAALMHNGEYLLESFRCVYLSGGRDLLRPAAARGRGTVVFAGPDFDLSLDGASLPPERRGRPWKPLEGAAAEVNDIHKLLGEGTFAPVQTFQNGEAREEKLRAVRSPRLLHLATHGFFYPRPEGVNKPTARDLRGPESRLRAADDPLLRSGLVLAGANTRTKTRPLSTSADDGWVTAEEVALLDLRGTELVVLSACESGLGDIGAGEGVYGLRRAFLYAGVRALVGTLDSVDDVETRRLMKDFYTGLAAGRGKLASLHQAQRDALKRRRDDNGGVAHPFYWGAFVLVGDWR